MPNPADVANPIPLPATSNVKHIFRSSSSYSALLVPLVLFPLSTALVFLALASLPLPSPLPTAPTPKSLSLIAASLADYAALDSSQPFQWSSLLPTLHLLAAFAVVTVWKHAWSVPGAILLNVLAGAIWGAIPAAAVMTFLTAAGSLSATLISRTLSQWFEGVMPRAIQVTKAALGTAAEDGSGPKPIQSATWVRLALLRLIGVVPWSGLNIASGIVRVPLLDCFLGALLGCLPWTVVTCQVGDVLTALAQGNADRPVSEMLATWDVLWKLALLTTLSVLPIFAKGAITRFLSSPQPLSQKIPLPYAAAEDRFDEKKAASHHHGSWRWSFSSTRPQAQEASLKERGEFVDARRAV